MERNDWDERYKQGFYNGTIRPHDLLVRFWREIPGGIVADIAMGTGVDALFLAEKGYDVVGIENSREAIKIATAYGDRNGAPGLTIVNGDARTLPIKDASLQGVIVFYFLLREITETLKNILKKDGILIYETFLKRQNSLDRHRDPAYLLEDAELIDRFGDMGLIHYEEMLTVVRGKTRAIARFVGRKL